VGEDQSVYPAGTAQFFKSLGLPGELAYLTIAAEVGGGLLLILGIETRWVALALVAAHARYDRNGSRKAGWLFTNKDGGWEYPAFWTVGLLALALLGDGAARSDRCSVFERHRTALQLPALSAARFPGDFSERPDR